MSVSIQYILVLSSRIYAHTDSALIIVTFDSSLCDIQEQEMEKQKLLFHQARLADRGVAEMVLLHISASKGVPSEMVMKTLQLGISILRGGNIEIQMVCSSARNLSLLLIKNYFNLLYYYKDERCDL